MFTVCFVESEKFNCVTRKTGDGWKLAVENVPDENVILYGVYLTNAKWHAG